MFGHVAFINIIYKNNGGIEDCLMRVPSNPDNNFVEYSEHLFPFKITGVGILTSDLM